MAKTRVVAIKLSLDERFESLCEGVTYWVLYAHEGDQCREIKQKLICQISKDSPLLPEPRAPLTTTNIPRVVSPTKQFQDFNFPGVLLLGFIVYILLNSTLAATSLHLTLCIDLFIGIMRLTKSILKKRRNFKVEPG